MDNFTYWAPTRYIFGTEAELRAGEQLEKEGISRVLIVYGGGSAVRSTIMFRRIIYFAYQMFVLEEMWSWKNWG